MSLKYSSTTADYLQWSEAMNLIRKLAKDGNYRISLLISLGCFTGLRISDILALRWKQILTYIIHSGFISGYQNRYGDNLKPPTNVYHRMTA